MIIYLTLIVAVILKLVTTSGVLFITMKLKTLISLTALTGIILLTCQYLISQNPAVQQQNELQASLNHNKKLISKADSKNPPSEKQTSEDMSISMIGDSVTLGAVEALKNDFKDIEISAKEGRQVIQAESIVSNWKKQGSLKKNVVIALGTNGPFTEDVGQSLIDAIGKKHQIYWINTYGTHLQWQEKVNDTIASLARKNKNVHLVDWAKEGAKHQDWFYSDGIHLIPNAQVEYANFIKNNITN